MSTLLIVIAWLALLHFVYEAIIAPSVRVSLRNKLFTARDELRSIKIEGIHPEDEKAFWLVEHGINTSLRCVHQMLPSSQAAALEAYRCDPGLRAELDDAVAQVQGSSDPRIAKTFNHVVDVVQEAYIVNSGGWAIYAVPLAVMLMMLSQFKRMVTRVLVMPDRVTDKLFAQVS